MRLIPLEELPESYAQLLLRWRNAPEVRSQMLHQGLIAEETHRIWYERTVRGQHGTRVRVAFEDGTPFGIVNLSDIDPVLSCASWGLYIGDSAFRGQGLGGRMVRAIQEWGFGELGLYRLYTSVLEGNNGALALYLKAGFCQEGVWPRHVLCEDGRRVDLIWVGMNREDWTARME